jgi:hypothetical protein
MRMRLGAMAGIASIAHMMTRRAGTRLYRCAALAMLACAPAVAEDDGLGPMGDLASPVITPMAVSVSVGVDREVPQDIAGTDESYSRTTTHAALRGQVWRDQHDELLLTASGSQANIQGGAAFPQTGPLPHQLDTLQLGVFGRTIRPDGNIYGVSLSAGSVSNKPFHDSSDMVFGGSVFWRKPASGRDAWLFFIAYSDDRAELNYVPVPGFEYIWNPNHEWTVMTGFPIESALWRPSAQWRVDALVSGFGNGHLGATWNPGQPWRREFRWRWSLDYGGDVYRRDDAPDPKDRIIFRELRATTGPAWDFTHGKRFDAYAGWAMDRRIYEGTSFLHDSNVVVIRPGWVGGVNAAWRF